MLDSEIDAFLGILERGMNHLVDAGVLLDGMLSADQGIFRRIMERCAWITEDSLHTLVEIGRKKYRPEIFFTRPDITKRLAGYSYREQTELVERGVPVVVRRDKGVPVVENVRLTDLSPKQARIALGPAERRSVGEQSNLLKAETARSDRATISDFKSGNPRINASEFSGLKPTNPVQPVTPGTSMGFFRLVMKFGQPAIVRIPKDAAQRNPRLQRLTLHAGMLDELESTFELVKPTTPVS